MNCWNAIQGSPAATTGSATVGWAIELGVLKVHLRREVVEVVPVAERVVTAEEWTAMGDHSAGAIPKSRLLPQLGMLLANSTPADRESFYAGMPLFIKVLWRLVGKRQYAKQFRQLFPGEPVPPTG